MSIERVKSYFKKFNMEQRIVELTKSSATVELAAIALNCEPERIAKTISFIVADKPILVVMAGDAKISNQKFKEKFSVKPKMIEFAKVESLTGHAVGGVCPFAVCENVDVYLDVSLKRFKTVFPAAGSDNSAIELTMEELEKYSNSKEWIDVSKDWNN